MRSLAALVVKIASAVIAANPASSVLAQKNANANAAKSLNKADYMAQGAVFYGPCEKLLCSPRVCGGVFLALLKNFSHCAVCNGVRIFSRHKKRIFFANLWRRAVLAKGVRRDLVTLIFIVWATVGIVLHFFVISLPAALSWANAVFLCLAAAVVFQTICRQEGPSRTLAAFFLVSVLSAALETVGTLTGFPFGQYYYSERLGWKIASVLPFTIPLAWWVIVGSGHFVLRCMFPFWSRLRIALGVGLWALVHDLLLEPFAWRVRGYWSWGPWDDPMSGVPASNYVTWFVAAAVMSRLMPLKKRLLRWDGRPVVVTVLMLATFLAGIFGEWLSHRDIFGK